jgi:hypothetical protein
LKEEVGFRAWFTSGFAANFGGFLGLVVVVGAVLVRLQWLVFQICKSQIFTQLLSSKNSFLDIQNFQ